MKRKTSSQASRKTRATPAQAKKQVLLVTRMREKGLGVGAACSRIGISVPTYYLRIRKTPALAPARGAKLRTRGGGATARVLKTIDGRTIWGLRRKQEFRRKLATQLLADLRKIRKMQRELQRSLIRLSA